MRGVCDSGTREKTDRGSPKPVTVSIEQPLGVIGVYIILLSTKTTAIRMPLDCLAGLCCLPAVPCCCGAGEWVTIPCLPCYDGGATWCCLPCFPCLLLPYHANRNRQQHQESSKYLPEEVALALDEEYDSEHSDEMMKPKHQ